MEIQRQVDVAIWVWKKTADRIPSSSGKVSPFLKALDWLDEAHPHMESNLPYSKYADLKVNLI